MGRCSDFTLQPREHDRLIVARLEAQKAKDQALSLRIRAIILLGAVGKKRVEVAEICETSVSTVYSWQRRYLADGLEGLRDKYKPKKCALSEEQLAELDQILISGPEATGLDTGTWTAALVRDVIKEQFGTAYSVSAVTKILHRLSFSAQVPKIQLARADPKAQKRWIKRTLPGIMKRARKEGGRVFFSRMRASSSSPAYSTPSRS